MYYSVLPQETIGVPVSSANNLQSAVTSFQAAIAKFPKPEYHLAQARAHYLLGNKTEAVSFAQKAINLSATTTRFAQFDQLNDSPNTMESALLQKATFDNFQPLPTLDFLGPKYSFLTVEKDPSMHYLKVEEAYLIMAEANLSSNNPAGAQTNLESLLAVISTREVRDFDDKV
ncbi:hypothetical protein CW731_14725 [Polaribacter sp. ALD11]|uniref:tetratricopeptide repeat protein n=1 Tax=Polaribacter sp. ALD11 TaxID=2058137 RepID=UPI000C31B6E7|nr:tetratricopeptide repeat protein [Polaribacter sp. ALD11]AUC86456.1 hypothetical protein CW731_14725 [Polaribacter sp. ALD11]